MKHNFFIKSMILLFFSNICFFYVNCSKKAAVKEPKKTFTEKFEAFKKRLRALKKPKEEVKKAPEKGPEETEKKWVSPVKREEIVIGLPRRDKEVVKVTRDFDDVFRKISKSMDKGNLEKVRTQVVGTRDRFKELFADLKKVEGLKVEDLQKELEEIKKLEEKEKELSKEVESLKVRVKAKPKLWQEARKKTNELGSLRVEISQKMKRRNELEENIKILKTKGLQLIQLDKIRGDLEKLYTQRFDIYKTRQDLFGEIQRLMRQMTNFEKERKITSFEYYDLAGRRTESLIKYGDELVRYYEFLDGEIKSLKAAGIEMKYLERQKQEVESFVRKIDQTPINIIKAVYEKLNKKREEVSERVTIEIERVEKERGRRMLFVESFDFAKQKQREFGLTEDDEKKINQYKKIIDTIGKIKEGERL